MKAKVNGVEVEGTPEEIAKLLGINFDDSKHAIANSNTYGTLEKCNNCPHNGEGCNPQFCL